MNKKTSKRQQNIKSKLLGAVCMLMVASIMMVSTTYAWFTLSTAPEVTGIQTAVGANGNLEMALLPTSGDLNEITSNVGDSNKDQVEANVTWGNLVDLEESYGLEDITLYPAQLNATSEDANGNPEILGDILLSTPKYGADGRISELSKNTVTSTYVNGSFPSNGEYGVRAVGVASGMTDRQLAYRNARSAANTAMNQAKSMASRSLNTNGAALANLALKQATKDNPTFNNDDVASLQAIVTDLVGTVKWNTEGTAVASISENSVLGYIEQAYIQYIYAFAISNQGVADDAGFTAVKAIVTADDATLSSIIDALDDYVEIPTTVTTPVNALKATILNVAQAQKELTQLASGDGEYTWTEIKDPLYKLAKTEAMEVNDIAVGEVMDNMDALVNSVMGSGLTVTIATGGGVYADIADHCGDYSASVSIAEVSYGGITLKNTKATMTTKTAVNPVYLSALGSAVQNAGSPESAEGTTMPLTDLYGYIIDLAFRTNAAESNLLLQQKAADRIYDENSNEETMGHGSTMTFKATTTDFGDAQVKALMDAVRIVFFQNEGSTNKVIATAKLDTKNATLGADGWTAEMYLYTVTAGSEVVYEQATYDATSGVTYYTKSTETQYTEATGITAENFATTGLYVKSGENTYTPVADDEAYDAGTTYYTAYTADVYTELTGTHDGNTPVYIKKTTTAGENKKTDNVIMPLTQNQATKLSVLVYLDGDKVTNADVAATGSTSMTGTMNLQFSSSANLVPMEYADLHTPGATTPTEDEPAASQG